VLSDTQEGDKTFIRITQKDIFNKLQEHDKILNDIHLAVKLTNGSVRFQRHWLTILSGIVGTSILFILSILLR